MDQKGFYRFWSDEIPDSSTRAKPDKCQTLFNWVPGRTMTMKLPDPNKQVGSMGMKTVQNPDACWRKMFMLLNGMTLLEFPMF